MKKIKIGTIIIFALLLFIPLYKFNFQENAVSEIDNRMLTKNPFCADSEKDKDDSEEKDTSEDEEEKITEMLENYVQDRIGFREDMIYLYTVANDRLFDKMVHPTYTYGKDGYVFFKLTKEPDFGEYHIAFVDAIEKIQKYCESRNVPFLFVFNPAKVTVLQDELPDGINYNNDWVKTFMSELDDRGINYVDNTSLLEEKTDEGEVVFNKKYNAGHWNDLGAFYGCNNILTKMQTWYPQLHINEKSEYNIKEKLNTTLQVSEFPIHEYEPIFELKSEVEDITKDYEDDLYVDDQYRHFQYVINEDRKEE